MQGIGETDTSFTTSLVPVEHYARMIRLWLFDITPLSVPKRKAIQYPRKNLVPLNGHDRVEKIVPYIGMH
jgi:hypothetical protein